MTSPSSFGSEGDVYQQLEEDDQVKPAQLASKLAKISQRAQAAENSNAGRGDDERRHHTLNDTQDAVLDRDLFWEMNYHEAAIFLQEGRNNEKFDSHPRHPEDLPAYLLVHNDWYYGLDLLTSLVLLGLAFFEEPAVPALKWPVWAHGSLELIALVTIGIELTLKLRWIGWATMLRHKRTALKCVTLGIMFIEALIVIFRQSSHFRVTRALRPIFLVDTKFCGGVRRFIRQILQTLPPILDMLGLLLFFMLTFMVLGHYMFYDTNSNFATLQDSFVSLFVLLTTANFPDVMMPSFALSKWYGLYFVAYLCVMLYIMMNLMLAVVNETFTTAERDKFKKLFLHKRKACQHAFRLLTSRSDSQSMEFRQFEGLMRYYAPYKSPRDVILMYRYMNVSGNGLLTSAEFHSVYDAESLKFEPEYPNIPWYHNAWPPLQFVCQKAHSAIQWPYFEYLVYASIVGNATLMLVRLMDPIVNLQMSIHAFAACWDTLFYGGIFMCEALIKVLGLGVRRYLSSGWNLFDLGTSVMTIVAACVLTLFPDAVFFVLFRPLRTLRLFKIKKRYRDVFGTLVILSPLMCSAVIVMLVLYYFFAIIGMELFGGYDLRNCCKNTTVEDFYKYSGNESTSLGYYYLNTFDNLMASIMTLFELTVVNNWFIPMFAFTHIIGHFTRVYFMAFYLITMVVLTIVVSSFLEAFRFRIQYKKATSKSDEERMLHEQVALKWEELQSMVQDFQLLEQLRSVFVVGGTTIFIGSRPRTREILQRRMYVNEINEWIAEMTRQEDTEDNGYNPEHVLFNGLSLRRRRSNDD